MIIKGGSRAGPKWLGNHLTRTDTNERVSIIELQSPHSDLTETFRDWQTLAAGTRGVKGLYHANIDPATDYTLTPEQWMRSVEVLERELGLEGQPRAIVMHEKHGRTHLHAVWARTDTATMTMRSDSNNYLAHERASLQLEQEFGHEHVPGKHAKRDREKQPEPPKSKFTHDEWQQAERAGVNPHTMRDDLSRLREQADNGQAFRAALEEAGYLLAQGDKGRFIVVDADGKKHNLTRVTGMKAAEVRDFMADIDLSSLPMVDDAIMRQREAKIRAADAAQTAQDEKEESGTASGTPDLSEADRQLIEREAKLVEALADRQAEEREKQRRRQDAELEQLAVEEQKAAEEQGSADTTTAEDEKKQEAPLLARMWQRVREILSPEIRRTREAEEKRKAAAVAAQKERRRLAAKAIEKRRLAARRQKIHDRHRDERYQLAAKQAEEQERRLEAMREAHRLALELERQRQQQLEQKEGRGPPAAR